MRTRYGVNPDMWILSDGVKIFLTNVRKENFTYFLAGPNGQDVFKSGLNGENSKKIDIMNDCMIFECKPLEVPGSNEPINLLLRNRTIGEYYPMMPHVDVDAKYSSTYRTISVFDAQKDGFAKITLDDALNACPRFLTDDRLDGALNFTEVPPENLESDLFLYDGPAGNKVVVNYFGDMRQDALPDKAVRDFVRSVLNGYDGDRVHGMRQALEDGVRLIEEIEDISPHQSAVQDAYFGWLRMVYGTGEHEYDIIGDDGSDINSDREDDDDGSHNHAAAAFGAFRASGVPITPEVKARIKQEVANYAMTLPQKDRLRVQKLAKKEAKLIQEYMLNPGTSFAPRVSDEDSGVFEPEYELSLPSSSFKKRVRPESDEASAKGRHTTDTATGLFDLPLPGSLEGKCWTSDRKNPLFIPCGYSTFAGLSVLAKRCNALNYESYNKRAAEFVNAVTTLYSRLTLTCRANIFCDAAHQPSYLLKADGRNTLVSNIITMPQPPLVIKPASKAVPRPETFLHIKLVTGEYDIGSYYTHLMTHSRIKRYMDDAFQVSNDLHSKDPMDNFVLRDDYASDSKYTSTDQGPRLRKLEAVLCMAATHATYSASTGISSFVEGKDGVFVASAEEHGSSKEEDIELSRELAATIIKALKTIGIDSDSPVAKNAAVKVVMLMLMMRFGPNPMDMSQIYGLMHSVSNAKTKKTLVAFIQCADAACTQWLKDQNKLLKDLFIKELIDSKLLEPGAKNLRNLRQMPDEPRASVADIHEDIMTPLAGSMAMLRYFAANNTEITVANNGRYANDKYNQAYSHGNNTDWSEARSHRYTHAAFKLENTTVATKPRFSGAPFSRDGMYMDGSKRSISEGAIKRMRGPNGMRVPVPDGAWDMRYGFENQTLRDDARGVHFEDGSDVAFSYNFVSRFGVSVNGDTDVITRCVAACFLGTGVNRRNLRNFIERDVVFPFSFLLFRPYMEFRMASGILAKAGRATGETIIGPQNFMLGDDSVKKTHYGNYTINLRSLVYTDRNVHLQADMAFDRYIRGMDTSFVRNRQDHDSYVHAGDGGKSIYAILEPYDGAEKTMRQNPVDISGRRSSNVPQNTGFENQNMYSSCDWYNNYFSFSNDEDMNSQNELALDQTRTNSLVYLGHTGLYNPKTGQTDLTIVNTGHLGPNIYQNVVKVWNGFKTQMQTITFPSVYGGGGQSNRVTLGA
jgi:hypothetical protein